MTTITIRAESCTRDIEADALDGLAVHERMNVKSGGLQGGWCVTHVNTGMIVGVFENEATAKEARHDLLELISWVNLNDSAVLSANNVERIKETRDNHGHSTINWSVLPPLEDDDHE